MNSPKNSKISKSRITNYFPAQRNSPAQLSSSTKINVRNLIENFEAKGILEGNLKINKGPRINSTSNFLDVKSEPFSSSV